MAEVRVLVTCPPMQLTADSWLPRFAELGIEVEIPPVVQSLDRDELLRLLPQFDGIIAGDDPLDAEVLRSAASRLRVVSRWGVGIDNVDLDAARELGIIVTNTPAVFAEEVADVALGYLILLSRRLHQIDAGVREGSWPKPQGRSFTGLTLGIIGVGAIGRALARRGLALGMKVIGSDPDPRAWEVAAPLGIEARALDDVVETADVISLHCPMAPENRHLISRERLARMKPGTYLINTSRGPLVDEAALIDALRVGRLAGAGLDVFETEPPAADSPLRTMDNVILGSHNASNTAEAVARVNQLAIDNLLAALERASV